MACFFICITVSFQDQKFLILIKSNLSIFILCIMLLVSNTRNLCPIKNHKYKYFLCFFPSSFKVVGFPFRTMIYFELICVYGERYGLFCLGLISCILMFSCFNTICLKKKKENFTFLCQIAFVHMLTIS